MGREGIEPSVR